MDIFVFETVVVRKNHVLSKRGKLGRAGAVETGISPRFVKTWNLKIKVS
jgi:hypothetical protein